MFAPPAIKFDLTLDARPRYFGEGLPPAVRAAVPEAGGPTTTAQILTNDVPNNEATIGQTTTPNNTKSEPPWQPKGCECWDWPKPTAKQTVKLAQPQQNTKTQSPTLYPPCKSQLI